MRNISIIILLFFVSQHLFAQFSRQDSLRGSVTPERAWWNVLKYDITIQPDFSTKSLKGKNIISAKAVTSGSVLQIDLQEPMQITAVVCARRQLKYRRDGNLFYIQFPAPVEKGALFKVEIDFEGKPKEAVNPPWDGGWIWKKDSQGNPWMSAACQILGGSVWYPCKDHQADEPDSATLAIVVPDSLQGIGNGRLLNTSSKGGLTTYTWGVVNPINNYNIIPYIGKYTHWSETFQGEKGKLDLDYWVLAENEEKARAQFKQVPLMMKCFEHWFGPYPFYEDGYKLVESPHLGMEHQSAIAYGNKFRNGYMGRDLSETGWGKKWDFIIVHESGHEWFANNITTKDVADMWVHEGFTNYSEVLFTECEYGREAGNEYCRGLRKNIQNDIPVLGQYDVNKEGSVDMYYKAANMIHMIRQIINDDEKFRSMLRGMNSAYYHETVTGDQIRKYISKSTGRDLSKVFDQYLTTTQVPVFQYTYSNNKLRYRWVNCVEGFDMPLRIYTSKEVWLYPETEWKTTDIEGPDFKLDPNFYVNRIKM